jgi:rubrerythrin
VKLETGSDGRTAANHQTVTGSQLKQALTAFFDTAVKASATPLQAMPAGGQPAAASAVKFCGQCGTKMDQAAAFCPNCGAPQQG